MLNQVFRYFASKKPAFDITAAAANQIKKLLNGDFENKMLRIGLKSGGCAGFQYDFTFDNAAREGDHLFKKDGAQVVLDQKAMLYLRNSTLDFTSDRFSSTFKIVIPTESNLHSCSCGKSVGGDGDFGDCGHH